MKRKFSNSNCAKSHLRFDDEEDEIIEYEQSENSDKFEEKNSLKFTLVKYKKEASFGFDVKSKSNEIGLHFLDAIEPSSAAERAGLLNSDRIVRVNNVDVKFLTAIDLIELIGLETRKDKFKLNLTIIRGEQLNNFDTKKRSLSTNDSDSSHDDENNRQNKLLNKIKHKFDQNFKNEQFYNEVQIRSEEALRLEKISHLSFFCAQRANKRANVPSKIILDMKAKETQRLLSEQGKLVTWQEIMYELLTQYESCVHIGDLGLNSADQLHCINELIRLQKRVDAFLVSFEHRAPCLTLIDLEKALCNDYNFSLTVNCEHHRNKAHRFQDLMLGPLIKNQLVRQMLQIPDEIGSVNEMKPICMLDLLKTLEAYLNEFELWSSKKVKVEEFEAYLSEHFDVQAVFYLGVKINNLGALIGSIKNVQYSYSELLKGARLKIVDDLKLALENGHKLIVRKFEQFADEATLQKFVNIPSVSVIEEFMTVFEGLYRPAEFESVAQFLRFLKNDHVMRDCFQLGLCLGETDLDKWIIGVEGRRNAAQRKVKCVYQNFLRKVFLMIVEAKSKSGSVREIRKLLGFYLKEYDLKIVSSNQKTIEEKAYLTEDTETDSDSEASEKKRQSPLQLDQLKADLVEFLHRRTNLSQNLTIENLIELEREIWLKAQKPADSFIDFLKSTLAENGLNLDILTDKKNNNFLNNKFKNHLSIIEHKKQLTRNNNFNGQEVDSLLCVYHGLENLNDLKKEENSSSLIIYADSLITDVRRVSDESLFKRLIECPLLANVSEFLNWPGSYEELTETLFKQSSLEGEMRFLETSPGVLLKLTSNTDINRIKKCIELDDHFGAVAYLVSLVSVKYGSVKNAPNALIGNEIQSAFVSLLAGKEEIYSFVAECLIRLPAVLVKDFVFEYFLSPASLACGGDREFKVSLFDFLSQRWDEEKMCKLRNVGGRCSIYEWSIEATVKRERKECRKVDVLKLPEKIEELKKNIEKEVENYDFNCDYNEVLVGDECDEFGAVAEIRKKFGIDMSLDERVRLVTESLKGVIGRSLESLSNELYNKDMHFVLELIQNADDNLYAASTKCPTLVFVLEEASITLFNNELGFSKKNLLAICDVKASTKGKHQSGYIGRKGIGFKSVFTVTDRPEIHSNGFHIKFDLSHGHIGYILPHWIQQSDYLLKLKSFVEEKVTDENEFKTCIHLPLKSESSMQRHKSSLLTSNFNDIKPCLLLFLNRLRKLVLMRNDSLIELSREEVGENVVELKTKTPSECESEKWLVVSERISVPPNLRPVDTVESTEICLAFCLDSINEAVAPKLDVYAYLPLRSFGFSFIIQADFEVPASRQDVHQSSQWNQMLLSHIPLTFINSFNRFKQLFQSDKLKAANGFFKFVPVDEEILGVFHHIPSHIVDLLRKEECIPAVDESGEEVVWKRPVECVLADTYVRQVLTSHLLKTHLGRFYVHPDLTTASAKLLTRLGIRAVTSADLLDILKSTLSPHHLTTDSKSAVRWLLLVHHCLAMNHSQPQHNLAILNQLKKLCIIPIKNRSDLVNLESNTVFFPHTNKKHFNSLKLKILDADRFLKEDDLNRAKILDLFKSLGVKQAEPLEIINSHILPALKQTQPDQDLFVPFLLYIFSHSNQNFDPNEIKEFLRVKTNKGFTSLGKEAVYLTPVYGSKYDLKNLLPSYDWCLLDSVYSVNQSKEAIFNLSRFFIQLGVCDLFAPKLVKTQPTFSLLEKFKDKVKNSEISTFLDYECDVFNFYSLNPDLGRVYKELGVLYALIEENWEGWFGLCGEASVGYVSGEVEPIGESSFGAALKSREWICVGDGEVRRGSQVFSKEPVLMRFYGNRVPFTINQPSKSMPVFARYLGIKTEFNFAEFIQYFKDWTNNSECVFEASVDQMRHIYQSISSHLNSAESHPDLIQQLHNLTQHSIIFIPNQSKPGTGRLYKPSQVYFSDRTQLFHKYKPANEPILLDSIYSTTTTTNDNLKNIFLNDFKVNEEPKMEHYLTLFDTIPISEQSLSDIYQIYDVLHDKLQLDELNFSHKKIIPGRNLTYLSINDEPLIVDDEFLAEKFEPHVGLVLTPSQLSAKQTHFLTKILKLNKLSDLVSTEFEINADSLLESSEAERVCAKILPFIQYYLASKLPETQKKQSQIGANLLKLTFLTCDQIESVHVLKKSDSTSIRLTSKYFFDLTNNWRFLIRKDLVNEEKVLIRGFVKLFSKVFDLSERFESELVSFCLLMNQFRSEEEINEEDRREVEKDHRVKLELGGGVEKWALKNGLRSLSSRKKLKSSLTSLSRGQIKVDNVAVRSGLVQPMSEGLKQIKVGGLDERGSEIVAEIGRLGELWLSSMLKEKFKNELKSGDVKIEWVNEEGESGLPFDFRIEKKKEKTVEFVEVKSTARFSQEIFPISYNELMFAKDNPEEFFIYRLYNVSSETLGQVELRVIDDVPGKLNSHQANLFIFI